MCAPPIKIKICHIDPSCIQRISHVDPDLSCRSILHLTDKSQVPQFPTVLTRVQTKLRFFASILRIDCDLRRFLRQLSVLKSELAATLAEKQKILTEVLPRARPPSHGIACAGFLTSCCLAGLCPLMPCAQTAALRRTIASTWAAAAILVSVTAAATLAVARLAISASR
jgi:hypothetical protein